MKVLDILAEQDASLFPEGFIDTLIAAAADDEAAFNSASEAALAEKDANANTLAAQLAELQTTNSALAAHNLQLIQTGGTVEGDDPTEDDPEDEDDYRDPVEKFFTDV